MTQLTLVALLSIPGLLPAAPGHAQTPDPTPPWDYYPLDVGNVWEYRSWGPFGGGDWRATITRDTLINDTLYVVEATESIPWDGMPVPYDERPVRYDTSSASVMARRPSGEEDVWHRVECPLDVPFGSITCDGRPYEVTGSLDTTFVLHGGDAISNVALKQFGPVPRRSYVAGIGYVEYDLVFEPGVSTLSYARIRGVEYGTPFTVAAEGEPGRRTGPTLTASQNPVRGSAWLDLGLDRPASVRLQVFDATGRQLHVLHDGPLPAGTHRLPFDATRLPSGVYVVRAAGAEGSVSLRLGVLR